MTGKSIDSKLWTPRSVEDTQAIYADWAAEYDADMARMAYATPDRVAAALKSVLPDPTAPILDFGCGTGLSGQALRTAGFATIDGTDISERMLDVARAKGLYRSVIPGAPGEVPGAVGTYRAIVATGVVSLGAAPPDMLAVVLNALAPQGLLAFSFNDPTLASVEYPAALDAAQEQGVAEIVFREHGPHLNKTVTGSDVIVLRRP